MEEHDRALRRARALMNSPEGQRLYRIRAGIEAVISQGVRATALQRARYRGLDKTRLQHVASAAALNLTRIGAWLLGDCPESTRTSRLARLAASPGWLLRPCMIRQQSPSVFEIASSNNKTELAAERLA